MEPSTRQVEHLTSTHRHLGTCCTSEEGRRGPRVGEFGRQRTKLAKVWGRRHGLHTRAAPATTGASAPTCIRTFTRSIDWATTTATPARLD